MKYFAILLCCIMSTMGLKGLAKEQAQKEWQILFDGTNTDAWRGMNVEKFPDSGWYIEDEMLISDPKANEPRDLITRSEYANFVLELEFKITEQANSGIKYFVVESLSRGRSGLGPEYQIIDDQQHPDAKEGRDGNHSMASLYDIMPPKADKPAKDIGAWNAVRIVSKNMRVEHWLNGTKVLEYKRDDPKFREMLKQSKFKDMADFGLARKGHILLQNHHTKVYFRKIRICEL